MHLQIAILSQLSVKSVTEQAILLKHVRQESPHKASKWPEVIKINNKTTAEHTIDVFGTLFSRLDLPNQIVSDNRPQFIS